LSELIAGIGAEAMIPSKRNRTVVISHDQTVYNHRNQIEQCFERMKHFRRFVHLAAAMMAMLNVDPA
jgi:1,4-alpha-glucan branching enzyme